MNLRLRIAKFRWDHVFPITQWIENLISKVIIFVLVRTLRVKKLSSATIHLVRRLEKGQDFNRFNSYTRIAFNVSLELQEPISQLTGFPICEFCYWVIYPDEPHDSKNWCSEEAQDAYRAFI